MTDRQSKAEKAIEDFNRARAELLEKAESLGAKTVELADEARKLERFAAVARWAAIVAVVSAIASVVALFL